MQTKARLMCTNCKKMKEKKIYNSIEDLHALHMTCIGYEKEALPWHDALVSKMT